MESNSTDLEATTRDAECDSLDTEDFAYPGNGDLGEGGWNGAMHSFSCY